MTRLASRNCVRILDHPESGNLNCPHASEGLQELNPSSEESMTPYLTFDPSPPQDVPVDIKKFNAETSRNKYIH